MPGDDESIATAARHGAASPRILGPLDGQSRGRFGRMFPGLAPSDLGTDVLDALAEYLARAGEPTDNTRIPAGYTYLGQFVDHDITFEATSNIGARNDHRSLLNFRTPRLDLDSLYGGGPADQPFLYDWRDELDDPGVQLLLDSNPKQSPFAPLDLPRNRQGRALVGDPRNDENVIVAQIHLLFARLHNKVIGQVRHDHPQMSCNAVFDEAQRIVRWHYQWIVIHDFLETIVGPELMKVIAPNEMALPGDAAIPVEFSGAAFRFGHSLVRNFYAPRREGESIPILRPRGEKGEHLGGLRRLRRELKIEWRRFFWDPEHPPEDAVRSMRIDTLLARPLTLLPPDGASLAALNLHRGRALGLPSGLDVAHAIGTDKILTAAELRPDIDASSFGLDNWNALVQSPPLWYYVLLEAQIHGRAIREDGHIAVGGTRLGPVGGRIVAQVLVGLLERDPHSYLHHQPSWTPDLGKGGDFTMRDLVRLVEGREKP